MRVTASTYLPLVATPLVDSAEVLGEMTCRRVNRMSLIRPPVVAACSSTSWELVSVEADWSTVTSVNDTLDRSPAESMLETTMARFLPEPWQAMNPTSLIVQAMLADPDGEEVWVTIMDRPWEAMPVQPM